MRRPAAPLLRSLTVALLLLAAVAQAARTQEGHGGHQAPASVPSARGHLGAQAILLLTRAEPAFGGRSYTEGYVTQPAVMGHLPLWRERLAVTGTLNLEPLTLERGELNVGIFGEGYVDRRHPHTLVHELMVTAATPARRSLRASLAAGKGFVPFGTDDPMVRAFAKYPINHHYAQILERAVAIGGVAWRERAVAELAAFNGDEPLGAYERPTLRRFGDSWAARVTLRPRARWEAQGSVARVESPENVFGGGLDQRKASLSARYAGPRAALLAEWARTDEYAGGVHAYRYESMLAEGSARWRGVEAGARLERTTRPEEERTTDVFRSVRPHNDYGILGLTRWHVTTARLAAAPRGGVWGVEPFVEVARSRAVALLTPSLFVPRDFYGASRLWSLSAGVRLRAGSAHARMGRYGVGRDAAAAAGGRHTH